MEYRILGELEVVKEGAVVPIPGLRQRALLALLLLHPGQVLSADRLSEELWEAGGEHRTDKRLQMAVLRLRRALEPAGGTALTTVAGGYRLAVAPEQVDLLRFEMLLIDGRAAVARGELESGRRILAAALDLWRGPPLREFTDERWAQREAARIAELESDAFEARVVADLQLGRHAELVAELERLVARWPLREGLRESLMLALYRSGRQADALAAYRDVRRALLDDLGLEPGPALRRLHAAILAHDPALDYLGPTHASVPAGLPPRLLQVAGTGFVGREAELASLEIVAAEARSGHSRAVLIGGEPGIGKTRLAVEVAERAARAGALVLDGRCHEGLAHPYQPFAELLDRLVEQLPATVLRQHVTAAGGELLRLVPRLRERIPTVPDPQRADAETERYLLFAAVRNALAAGCAVAPIVLVLDDLQWADRQTLQLLRHVLGAPGTPRLLVLGSFRSTELDTKDELVALLADLRRDRRVTQIALTGLDEREIAALLASLGGEHGIDLAARLHDQTGGNPFFVAELARALWDDVGAGDEAPSLPVSVRDTIVRRAARLGEEGRLLLETASAIGGDFDLDLLVALVKLEPDRVVELLDAATAAVLVRPRPEAPTRFGFVHALIEQALYATLGPARRLQLHRAIAEALEVEGSGAHPEQLAHHWARGSDPRRQPQALEYAQRAGDQALALLAPDEALGWFRRGLELLDRSGAADHARRCELLLGRGQAERQVGSGNSRETLLSAAELAQRTGDDSRLVRAALEVSRGSGALVGQLDGRVAGIIEAAIRVLGDGDSIEGSRLRTALAVELAFGPQLQRRRALGDEAVAMARRLADDGALAYALSGRFVPMAGPESFDQRRADVAEAIACATRDGDPSLLCAALHWRFAVCLEGGDIEEAHRVVERERAMAAALPRPTLRWLAEFDAATLAIIGGQLDEAEQLAHAAGAASGNGRAERSPAYAHQLISLRYEQGRLGELSDLIGDLTRRLSGVPGMRALAALAACERGDLDAARPLLATDAATAFSALPVDMNWLSSMAIFAHVACRLDEAGTARMIFAQLAPWKDRFAVTGSNSWGSIAHYLGMLAMTAGDLDAAEAMLGRALEQHQRVGAPIWSARTRVEIAELGLRRGAAATACQSLVETLEAATRLSAGGVAGRANALLASGAPASGR